MRLQHVDGFPIYKLGQRVLIDLEFAHFLECIADFKKGFVGGLMSSRFDFGNSAGM